MIRVLRLLRDMVDQHNLMRTLDGSLKIWAQHDVNEPRCAYQECSKALYIHFVKLSCQHGIQLQVCRHSGMMRLIDRCVRAQEGNNKVKMKGKDRFKDVDGC